MDEVAPAAPAPLSHRSAALRAACLAALAALAYAGSIGNGFTLDDHFAVVDNPAVNGALPLSSIVTRDFWGQKGLVGSYRPLAVATFRLDHVLGGGRASQFHATSVLLHALAIAVAYLSLRGLAGETVALVAAALAAVWPASAEAVQSIVGRADVLLALFALLGLWLHRRPSRLSGVGAAAAFAAALGSKDSAALVPVVWVAVDLVVAGAPPLRKRIGRLIGYAAVFAVYLAGRTAALGAATARDVDPVRNPLIGASYGAQVLGAARIFAKQYATGMVDPLRRLYACSAPECGAASGLDGWAWLGLGLLAGGVVLAVVLRRRAPVASAGLIWFGLLFLPASNLLIVGPSVYAERLLYAPSFGLALAFAAGAVALAGRARPALVYGALALLMMVNAAALQVRHADWHDDGSLFTSAVSVAPDSALVQVNAAGAALSRRDLPAAVQHAQAAVALAPDFPEAMAVLGLSLERQGKLQEADAMLRRAFTAPRSGRGITIDYADFLIRRRRFADAAKVVESGLKRRQDSQMLREALAKILEAERRAAGR